MVPAQAITCEASEGSKSAGEGGMTPGKVGTGLGQSQALLGTPGSLPVLVLNCNGQHPH